MAGFDQQSFFRYIPISNEARRWGLCVTDLGCTQIPGGATYPPGNHPEQYTFNLDTGRVLQEHQLVYITRGKGTFWCEASGVHPIRSGSLFLLFAGIRHGYQPHRGTGWDEQWVGFTGDHADRLMLEFFTAAEPVLQIGVDTELHALFQQVCELASQGRFGFRPLLAAKTVEIIARVHTLSSNDVLRQSDNEQLMRKTLRELNDGLPREFDFSKYALEEGMSYSSFRRLFKKHTGLAPNQYLLDIKLRRAQTLLTTTSLRVQRIAADCGFENQYYFSRFFKQRTGFSPLHYRKQFG